MTDSAPSYDLKAKVTISIAFSLLALSFATRSSLGLGMQRWITEFGWSRSEISATGSVAMLFMALIVSIAGYVADRFGPRFILAGGTALLAVSLMFIASMQSYWQLFFGYGVLGGICFGLISLPVAGSLVARHVSSRQGLAMGITTSGSTGGQLLILPTLAALFPIIGWRYSFACMALIALAIAAISFRGLASTSTGTQRARTRSTLRFRYLLFSPTFHGLFWSFLLCGFTSTGIVETHLIPFAEICGFTPFAGSMAYGVFAFFNLFGMLSAGYLSDRMDRRVLLVSIYAVRSAAFFIPMMVGTDYTLLLAFAVVVGIAFYATFPATIGLSAAHFGSENIGFVVGLLTVGHAIGAAAGAFLGGYIYDLFLTYDWIWILSVALAATSALFAMLVKDPRATRDDLPGEPKPAAAR